MGDAGTNRSKWRSGVAFAVSFAFVAKVGSVGISWLGRSSGVVDNGKVGREFVDVGDGNMGCFSDAVVDRGFVQSYPVL